MTSRADISEQNVLSNNTLASKMMEGHETLIPSKKLFSYPAQSSNVNVSQK
jgi:hypothetical protein